MVRRLIWSITAQNSRKNIFDYCNYRNKSKVYSNKLNLLFNENLRIVLKLPEFGTSVNTADIKFIIISHFELIYKITPTEIIVLDIWDTRQRPKNFLFK